MKIENKKDNRYIFTGSELNRYTPYISSFPVTNRYESYGLTQDTAFYPIYYPEFNSYKPQLLAGPIPQKRSSYANGVKTKK